MNEGWNVLVRYDEEWATVNVWLVNQQGERRIVVQPVNLTMATEITLGTFMPEPTFKFSGHDSQQFLRELADALVEAGFRPNELKAKDSEIEAIKAHLEDMRRIVFEALAPPELPPQLPKR